MSSRGEYDGRGGEAPRTDGGQPTLKTIAFMTGLGVTTVSRALKDASDISLDTRRRVQLVARQIGYRPNRAGVRLRTGKTNVISLVLDTDEQLMGFVSDIISGISGHLAATPYHLIVTPYSRKSDPMDPIRYVVETHSADGIILSRTEPEDARVRYLAERNFPFATHGRTSGSIAHAYHDFDNEAFARLAVDRLTALGRRRIALLAPPTRLTYHQHMLRGFRQGLAESPAREIPFTEASIDQPIEAIRDAARSLAKRDERPDGFICASAASALALVAGVEEAGLVIGKDFDVVSKQSANILPLFRREIQVVNEDFRKAGDELARSVLALIGGERPENLGSLYVPHAVQTGI
ncbi:substrate-binding domain-containing protein [Chelativorans sp. ZYF759]|uniref:LacI family transcriptional regulator n=1 Tax=Chelativorans sp. ZYF759 TaxID=2692213 RepID=UPI00145DCF56|nr:LacI family transcriptional regulator [Chelativorans sp. ZYF759]NMG40837.1 substrate-binding domain-containing protein [Chelativorans sp. ZYF759]